MTRRYGETAEYTAARRMARGHIRTEFGPSIKKYTSLEARIKNPLHACLALTEHEYGYRLHVYDGPLSFLWPEKWGKRFFVGVDKKTLLQGDEVVRYRIIESNHRHPDGSWANSRSHHTYTSRATKDETITFLKMELGKHVDAVNHARKNTFISAGALALVFLIADKCSFDTKPKTSPKNIILTHDVPSFSSPDEPSTLNPLM
jgi:hypothetical protein